MYIPIDNYENYYYHWNHLFCYNERRVMINNKINTRARGPVNIRYYFHKWFFVIVFVIVNYLIPFDSTGIVNSSSRLVLFLFFSLFSSMLRVKCSLLLSKRWLHYETERKKIHLDASAGLREASKINGEPTLVDLIYLYTWFDGEEKLYVRSCGSYLS